MRKYYTGIGSRQTPENILHIMLDLAVRLSQNGWTLRSGRANGADSAFEAGAASKEIFLPWDGFNNQIADNKRYIVTGSDFRAKAIVREILGEAHWSRLSLAAAKLHTRNAHQVLGSDLSTPSRFVVCWTPNGEEIGGTRTAILLAKKNNIEVINMGTKEGLNRVEKYLEKK